MNIHNFNSMHFYFGRFDQRCFKHSEVWYEYYVPSELEVFREVGADEKWIEENIFSRLEADVEMYYSSEKELFVDREFTYISCQALLSDKEFKSYLTMSLNDVTSLAIQVGQKEFIFYSQNMLSYEDNKKTLKSFFQEAKIESTDFKSFGLSLIAKVLNAFNLNLRFRIVD